MKPRELWGTKRISGIQGALGTQGTQGTQRILKNRNFERSGNPEAQETLESQEPRLLTEP